MNKVFLASIFIFLISASLYIGYWLGTRENFYQEAEKAIWDWCADSNNFRVCTNECLFYDQQCWVRDSNTPKMV